MKNNIKAEIVTHSKRTNTGEEIITYKLTFPRIILSEVNTYKMLEKNTSSSRAIPFEKMVEVVEKEPFVPIAWMLEHKGMQGDKYLTDPKHIEIKNKTWLRARDKAVTSAKIIVGEVLDTIDEKILDIEIKHATGFVPNTSLSKNYGNRLLEPFMWVTQLVTGSRDSFEHLFEQRCPTYNVENLKFTSKKDAIGLFPHLKDMTDLEWLQYNSGQAEIHFMDLAEKMYDALKESTPNILEEDCWHIPFAKEILNGKEFGFFADMIKKSVCLTAKISYTKIGDENSITSEKAQEMYERLKNSGHWSCFGHIAKCMTNEEYRSWIKGKIEREDYMVAIPQETHGYNKQLRGFISLRQYVEDNVELKDI